MAHFLAPVVPVHWLVVQSMLAAQIPPALDLAHTPAPKLQSPVVQSALIRQVPPALF